MLVGTALLGPTTKEARIGGATSSDQSWNIESSFLALVMDGDKLVTTAAFFLIQHVACSQEVKGVVEEFSLTDD
jgi:hypothetical protein